MSSGRSSTTIPELLQREPRLLGLIPLTTIWLGTAGGGHNEAAGTHAKAIYSSSVHLGDEAVFGGGQVFAAAVPAVVLYPVYQARPDVPDALLRRCLWLLFPHWLAASQRYTSRAECPVASITGPRSVCAGIGFNAFHFVVLNNQGVHARFKVDFAAARR